MAYFRCGGGGIPSSLKTDMNAVLNKKFGTQSENYPPTEWADDVNLMGLLPIRTASGTIAHFSDGADSVPMKSVVANIVPIQEGTGTPSPSNPRPISGTNELTLKHDNENMLVMSTFDFTIQGVRVYTNEDGNVVLNGTSTGGISSDNALWTNNLRFSLPKGHYYLSCNSFSTYGAVVVVKNTDTNATICQFNSNWQIDLTETTPMRIGIYIPVDKTFDNFVCNFEASLDNITYDVPNRKTYTVNLGRTVYGGTADVVGGVGSKTHGKVYLSDSSNNWTYTNGVFYTAPIYPVTYLATYNRILCSIYKDVYVVTSAEMNNNEIRCYSNRLYIKDSRFTDVASFVEGVEGEEICYELATPTDFTFTGQPINSYLGVNNLWTDSGEVLDVEYRADMNLLIASLEGNRGLQMMRATPTEENDEQEATENEDER